MFSDSFASASTLAAFSARMYTLLSINICINQEGVNHPPLYPIKALIWNVSERMIVADLKNEKHVFCFDLRAPGTIGRNE